MLNKLAKKRNVIALVMLAITLVFLIVYLIFGNNGEKIKYLVLTVLLAPLVYGFIKIGFKLILSFGTIKIIRVYMWFFLICGFFGYIMTAVGFITGFPNGFNPAMSAIIGLIFGVLDVAKKYD